MSRKMFTEGQQIEVRRRVLAGALWQRAKYGRPAATPGSHWVWVDDQQLEFATRNVRPLARKAAP